MKSIMQQFRKRIANKYFVFSMLLFAPATSNAQVGIGVTKPAPSAQLELSSSNKGFLPPQMTGAQRNAIVSPVAGLMIWCSNCGVAGESQVFNGTTWTTLAGETVALPSVRIGAQDWMAKNLDVATYRNGEPILQVSNSTEWANSTKGAWCYYDNNPANGIIYGKMYNWYAVHDPRGLAPQGWHIPNDAEWTLLKDSLEGESVAGGKIKDSGTKYWSSPNTGATNSSGFTGLPGGSRFNTDGSFHDLGLKSFWWSATELSPDVVSGHWLRYDDANLSSLYFYKSSGFSVRCLRGDAAPIVAIGTQTWTAKNLDVETYKNGDSIPEVKDPAVWTGLTKGAWCYYDNDPANGAVYGKLYNWYAITDPRGIAPKGYHVPGETEWTTLTDYLGGYLVAGGKMKSTTLWNSPNVGVTNSSGFTGFPGGYRDYNGNFYSKKDIGWWWSKTEQYSYNAHARSLTAWDVLVGMFTSYHKFIGFSVRCVKD